MSLIAALIALSAVAATGSPDRPAPPHRTTITPDYRVTFRAARDVYCLRILSDPAPADPRPGPVADACRTQAGWAREGITIDDPQRDAARVASQSRVSAFSR